MGSIAADSSDDRCSSTHIYNVIFIFPDAFLSAGENPGVIYNQGMNVFENQTYIHYVGLID